MKRRMFLAGTATATLARPAIAQTSKKLTFLSWNIVDQAEMFKRWFAAFTTQHPGVEINGSTGRGQTCRRSIRRSLPAARRPMWWTCKVASASNMPHRTPCSISRPICRRTRI